MFVIFDSVVLRRNTFVPKKSERVVWQDYVLDTLPPGTVLWLRIRIEPVGILQVWYQKRGEPQYQRRYARGRV